MEKNEKLLLETDFVSENLDEDDDNSAFDIMSKLKSNGKVLMMKKKIISGNISKY